MRRTRPPRAGDRIRPSVRADPPVGIDPAEHVTIADVLEAMIFKTPEPTVAHATVADVVPGVDLVPSRPGVARSLEELAGSR